MENGIRRRSRILGLSASIIGFLALLAVVIPQVVMPQPEPVPVNTHFSLKQRIVDKLKNIGENLKKIGRGKHEKHAEPLSWEQRLPIVAIFLALIAAGLATASIVWGEEPVFGGVAVTLGMSAIAFQLAFLFAIGVAVILLLYAALGQPDGAASLAIVAMCAIAVQAVLAILGMGLIAALVLIFAATAILTRCLQGDDSSNCQ